jgi:hypothetical protein
VLGVDQQQIGFELRFLMSLSPVETIAVIKSKDEPAHLGANYLVIPGLAVSQGISQKLIITS